MRSCKCTSHDLYAGGCQWQWQVYVIDTMVSVCMSGWVCVSVCHSSFSLSSWVQGVCLNPHHVNQGVFQKSTPQVTLYESHTAEESLRRPIWNSTPFFVIRLSLTSRTKYCVLLFDFSKTFLLVHVTWDFSLTDYPPVWWVTLVFLPPAPSPTVPVTRFVCLGRSLRFQGNTKLSLSHVFLLPFKKISEQPCSDGEPRRLQWCRKEYEPLTNSMGPPWVTSLSNDPFDVLDFGSGRKRQ